MVDKKIQCCGLDFKNPVIPASGTFGFGYEFAEHYDINVLGGISLKGTTLEERYGNELPRIAETKVGMLNAVGLQNGGVKKLVDYEVPTLRKVYDGIAIANISGFSIEEYVKTTAAASESEGIDMIELNISCPNVHGGGMSFGSDKEMAFEVCSEVRKVCKKPLFVKLSPNVTDIAEIARACEAAGADGISLINTLLGMRIDVKKRKPILANTTGGLSGGAIFPVALRMVWQVFQAVKIPVMGMGGIESARDVIEMMMAGASLVQVGAANLVNPYACRDIIADLDAESEKLGIGSLKEIIGAAHAVEMER